MLRPALVTVAICCQSCFTTAVWGDYGSRTESFQAHANFAVTTVGTVDSESLVLQGQQTDGQLAPALVERVGPTPWLLLQPDAGADAALAVLQHPGAFPLDSAEVTLAWEARGAAGEQWHTALLLRGRVEPAALLRELSPTDTAAADAAMTAADLPPLLQECERALCGVDWLAVVAATAGSPAQNRVLGWQDASGAPFAGSGRDATAAPAGFAAQLAALAGVRATMAIGQGDQLRLLSLSVPEAWTWARLRRNGGAQTFLHQSLWLPVVGRELPPHCEVLATAPPELFHLRLDSLGVRPARETFGSTMLRVLATPFACAADLAGGFLLFAFACATSDDDDDCRRR